MNPKVRTHFKDPRRLLRLSSLAALLGLAGCVLPDPDDLVLGAQFRPTNVHVEKRRLNPVLRRVAVLPLTSELSGSAANNAREEVETALRNAMKGTQRFEVVWLSPTEVRESTGRGDWSVLEELPADFFTRLQGRSGCDAVLFARLTRYEPYPPLAVGWHLKLVGSPTPQVLWELDEVFDAREPGVANAARRFQQSNRTVGAGPADSRVVLSSPRRFVAYAANATFLTLPAQ